MGGLLPAALLARWGPRRRAGRTRRREPKRRRRRQPPRARCRRPGVARHRVQRALLRGVRLLDRPFLHRSGAVWGTDGGARERQLQPPRRSSSSSRSFLHDLERSSSAVSASCSASHASARCSALAAPLSRAALLAEWWFPAAAAAWMRGRRRCARSQRCLRPLAHHVRRCASARSWRSCRWSSASTTTATTTTATPKRTRQRHEARADRERERQEAHGTQERKEEKPAGEQQRQRVSGRRSRG